MLDENAKEAFNRAEQGAVHHERLMLGAVFGNVLQAEARGQVEIELHGGELPGTSDGVNELHIDFRAVEGGFAGDGLVRDVHALHGRGERGGRAAPVFGLPRIILGMRRVPVRKLDFKLVETEVFHHRKCEIDARFHLRFDLRRHAEDVRVVLGKAADAQQSVEHPAALVAVDGAELGKPHGQIPIAVQPGLVNQDVARAVHGFELVIGFFHFHGAEHAVLVKSGVAAGFPQVEAHDVRRKHQVVAALEQLLAQPVFHNFSNQAALGVPENEARAGFLLDAEEVQFDAELAVIAALGFFKTVQMFVQLFLREESHGVNALELGIAFLAIPVGAGDVHQLVRLDALG